MTENKQIIIDGVDVSKCECCNQIDLDSNMICISNFPSKKSGYCKDNTNCLYKQHARKTQECEELKERLNTRCFDPKSNNNRCISYNRIAEDYERDLKQLDKLKTENEILKEKLVISFNSDKKILKIIQTLTEIKEIAEEDFYHTCWETYAKQLKQILQKISEVEDV